MSPHGARQNLIEQLLWNLLNKVLAARAPARLYLLVSFMTLANQCTVFLSQTVGRGQGHPPAVAATSRQCPPREAGVPTDEHAVDQQKHILGGITIPYG
jgi:hypothetical protein